MLYNNFIELRCECSFLDRVLAKNDVNETKKTYFSNEAERVSLARESCTRERHSTALHQHNESSHVRERFYERGGSLGWGKATMSALAASVGGASFASVASRKNSVT